MLLSITSLSAIDLSIRISPERKQDREHHYCGSFNTPYFYSQVPPCEQLSRIPSLYNQIIIVKDPFGKPIKIIYLYNGYITNITYLQR